MAAPDPAALAAIEARLWSMLEPYRGELEPATIYGIPSIRWPPGARPAIRAARWMSSPT